MRLADFLRVLHCGLHRLRVSSAITVMLGNRCRGASPHLLDRHVRHASEWLGCQETLRQAYGQRMTSLEERMRRLMRGGEKDHSLRVGGQAVDDGWSFNSSSRRTQPQGR
jgi:hypothetical protein